MSLGWSEVGGFFRSSTEFGADKANHIKSYRRTHWFGGLVVSEKLKYEPTHPKHPRQRVLGGVTGETFVSTLPLTFTHQPNISSR